MHQQDKQVADHQPIQIEDLAINDAQEAEVKGGGAVVFVGGWGSSSYQYLHDSN
jgi:hypothetical protein